MKTYEQHFRDWESQVFGYGYGTGEEYIIPDLRAFIALCDGENNSYSSERIEKALTPTVAWLFINVLCSANVLEYGCSSRNGWLTKQGEQLKIFILTRTEQELFSALFDYDNATYNSCFPDMCQCDGDECHNPFWKEKNAPNRQKAGS